jgi:hypothetical protein
MRQAPSRKQQALYLLRQAGHASIASTTDSPCVSKRFELTVPSIALHPFLVFGHPRLNGPATRC